MKNWIGKRFGMLTVVGEIKPQKYRCVCDCGHSVDIWDKFLYEGRTDCGCVRFKEKDLTGQKFGRLVVIEPLVVNRIEKWKCRCDCGKEMVVGNWYLQNGITKSCGCLQRDVASSLCDAKTTDLTGRRFGRLVVLRKSERIGCRVRWVCRCDCGKEKDIFGCSLTTGTKSCGCYRSEVLRKIKTSPNLTDEERELQRERRVDPKVLEWRIKVYRRDGDACVICGERRGCNLVAHHKEAWNSNKELRFDVGNGTTVCKKCHKEFHYLYGYGDNTESEWNEFLVFKSGCASAVPVRVVRRRKRVDLLGTRFGRLRVIDKGKTEYYWTCQCDCGLVKSINERSLVRGQTKSCGCLQREKRAEAGRKNLKDLTGRKFGMLMAMKHLPKQRWLCKCDCGNDRIVDTKFLYSGEAVDCQSQKNGKKCSLRRVA